jgi:hypothetical protein
MNWETPGFTEIKMDAEVSSYQGDESGTFASESTPPARPSLNEP